MIIAVDATGGDYAPHQIVKGAIKAAEGYNVEIALIGRKEILSLLARRRRGKPSITIVDASQTIDFKDSPIEAVTNKIDSSIVIGINLIKDGLASAFVSAGNTGAVFYAALVILGKMKGIERPAIASILNMNPTPTLLIDSGANVECRPTHLVQFAQLGSTYAREVLGISSPRVGLLNIGKEESKGNSLTKNTYPLLNQTDLNFIGSIEGQDISKGTADVIITDGFTGNIVLKTIEGLGTNWLYSLSQIGQTFSKAYSLPSRIMRRDMGMDSWTKRLDFQEYGGACLLGVNGNIIIAHGRSQAKAMENAIGLSKRTAERSLYEGGKL
ncbi:phosphate acyltransferase PlsX [Chloroflexota bacterium]